jgi:hypothetical protein
LIVQVDGLQDLNKSIDNFYAKFDKRFLKKQQYESRFRATVEQIIETLGDELVTSQFRKPPFFYTLFTVIYHRMFGVPKEKIRTPKKRLTQKDRDALREAISTLSRVITLARAEQRLTQQEPKRSRRRAYPVMYDDFARACLSQTDNIAPRRTRFENLYREAFA